MKTQRIVPALAALFLAGAAYAGSWYQNLDWPIGGYTNLRSGFGPRQLRTWFHTGVDIGVTGSPRITIPAYPTNVTAKVAKVLNHGGSGDYQYTTFETLNPGTSHEVKQFIYFHTTGTLVDGTQYAGGETVTGLSVNTATIDFGPHLHMSVYPDLVTAPVDKELRSTRNPYRYLLNGSCTSNTYTLNTGMDAAQSNFDYIELEIKESMGCRAFDKLEISLTGGANWKGDNVIGLNERKSSLFLNMSDANGKDGGPNATNMDNVYVNGVKIDADSHADGTQNQFVIRYRMYYNPNGPVSGEFSILAKDMFGITIFSRTKVPIPICIGCTPPPDAPQPPTSLAASSGTGGVTLSWPKIETEARIGYKLYRRGVGTPGIFSADMIGMNRPPIGTANATFLDPLSNPSLGTRPGARYLYSLASADGYKEGCNGPYVTGTTCKPPAGQTCGTYCPVKETAGNMPSAAMPAVGLTFKYQGAKKMAWVNNGTVGLSGGETGTALSGFVFKRNGTAKAAVSTTGFLTVPGSFSNNVPALIGLKFKSASKDYYLTDYGKLATTGPGVIQQYSN